MADREEIIAYARTAKAPCLNLAVPILRTVGADALWSFFLRDVNALLDDHGRKGEPEWIEVVAVEKTVGVFRRKRVEFAAKRPTKDSLVAWRDEALQMEVT